MADRFDLQRFVAAQEGVYEQVQAELTAGHKESHWMWFIFPQLAGLGRSAMARHYGLESREEAVAYMGHPVLGARIVACTRAVLEHAGQAPEAIFGTVDALKFRSSMTLFDAACAGIEPVYFEALAAFYDGKADPATLALLGER